ncbi:ABC transporter ATP-binding protein [Haloferula sp. BvORR071]|uniref:ABC transporter ATP-binding protein n=1 Tax=Haloferula sp. BvORR071 TaxID=1396141 RepID=UPI0006981287|nr:ABC transporter ATP-binding protein [Haloferula sp. BvORR071]
MDLAVEIQDLVKEFRPAGRKEPLRAVDQVSIRIAPGEVYGLIGPNGSGKSTTMKALLGLVRPDSGICRIFGNDSMRVDSRQDVGFLPENPYFYKHLSGSETLRFYGKLCGLRGSKLEGRVKELLALVDLTEAGNRRLGGYSKGMLQRIGLAQALIQEPRLVILDEPTAGVDPVGSREIRDLILDLKHRGITVFLCSHLLEQVQEVCDRVGIIFRGRMVKEGPIEELLAVGDQSELVLKDASPELMAKLRELVAADGKAELVRSGRPKTTLERLFLKETVNRDEP